MHKKEMRQKSVDDLRTHLLESMRKLFRLNMQKMSGQLVQFHLLGKLKRDIARTKTITNEKSGNKNVEK
jgi:large subunit ribosomal protein L29